MDCKVIWTDPAIEDILPSLFLTKDCRDLDHLDHAGRTMKTGAKSVFNLWKSVASHLWPFIQIYLRGIR